MERWDSKTIEAAQAFRELPKATQRVIALPIDVEIYVRQCRPHERFACEKCHAPAVAKAA